MGFKRARTGKEIAARQTEILDACCELYGKCGFDGVTVKAISECTSFSRPTIYNYYRTKEEILLGLLIREYKTWACDLSHDFDRTDVMDKEAFCQLLTKAYEKHELILKLITVNLTAIENNSRDERLYQFKLDMKDIWQVLACGLRKFFPDTPEEERQLFLFAQYAFICGIYPMTHASEKQKKAMKRAAFKTAPPFRTVCYEGLLRLMNGFR